MSSWDRIYDERQMTLWEPHETVVQFVGRFLKRRVAFDRYEEHRPVRRVLDLGCGNGAQSVYLARTGFEVYALDVSSAAIRIAESYADASGQSVRFSIGSCDRLAFDDAYFDAVVSYGVLDHVPTHTALAAVREVYRVLRPNGLAWVSLASTRSTLFGQGNRSERHTYVLDDGFEKGQVQHYFDQEEIAELFAQDQFRLLDLRHRLEEKWKLDDDTPALQSLTGRWFVTAQSLKSD